MKKNYILLLCITILGFSCNDNTKGDLLSNFSKIENIYHSPIKIDDDSYFSRVYEIFYADNKIIANDVDDKYVFSITDLENNTMVSKFGEIGQGPKELISMPSCASLIDENTIGFFESNKSIWYTINFVDPTNTIFSEDLRLKDVDNGILTLAPLSQDLFVATGMFDDGKYLLLNRSNGDMSYYFGYPTLENEHLFSKGHKDLAFQSHISVRPDGKRFFATCRNSEVFDIIEVVGDNKLNKVFEFVGELGHYKPEGDGVNSFSTPISKNSKIKFIDSCGTQDYIYILYSNKVIGDNIYNALMASKILVYNWNGKPIKILDLDTEVSSITVNDSNTTLYAYSNEAEELLEFEL